MKKEIIVAVVVVSLFLLPELVSASLGLTPASVKMNFVPNFKKTFRFRVRTDDQDKKIGIYAKGDLSEYVSFNKKELTGSGKFEATLDLPSEIEEPGPHRILIGVKESLTERQKEVKGFIGTRVKVQGVISVFVPYPGKYLVTDLKTESVNAGEDVEFELKIDNKGKEKVEMSSQIEIWSGSKKIEELNFYDRELESKESITLQKKWDSEGRKPGNYEARAIVDYGKIANDTEEFSLGHLFVDLVNYSERIEIGEIKDYDLEVESRWNGEIGHVYANVEFSNETSQIVSFKTSPTSLEPWQKETLTGFFDSSKFEEGEYDGEITLFYAQNSSSHEIEVEFYREEESNLTPILIGAGLLIFLIVVIISVWRIKNGNKK